MRRRSGALHCQTEQQLLQLASNNQMGIYYNQGPNFEEVKFQNQWNLSQAQNFYSSNCQKTTIIQQQTEEQEQLKQLAKGKRYMENCIVDKQIIRCSIQICIITSKIEQVITKILNKDTFLDLFIHSKESGQNCMYKNSIITSHPYSNVINLQAHDLGWVDPQIQKQNIRMTPKNWLKNSKIQRMIELLIIKKHIGISDNCQIGPKKITIIHRIFIIDEKYLHNPLIKIYLKKSHYVVQMINETSKSPTSSPTKQKIYQKLFKNRAFFQKECLIFNKGEYDQQNKQKGQQVKFKYIFHKLQERIAKQYMRKLNQMLLQDKRKISNLH